MADASEVAALRLDAVHTARRDFVELGLWLRDSQPSYTLSADAASALVELEPWWLAGAAMDGVLPGATLAWHMDLNFRPQEAGQTLIDTYGGGDNGLNLFLKSVIAGIHSAQPLAAEEADYVDRVLAGAWTLTSAIGPSSSWPNWFQSNVLTFDLEALKTLEGLAPPAGGPAPVSIGPVACSDGGSLCSPPEQSNTQIVEPGGSPVARSLLPPGASEHAGPHELDQVPLWENDATKQAPRTLAEVQASGPFTETMLKYSPPSAD